MYYNSAIAFALVEVNARTPGQIPVMFFLYLMNALFNATIFGIFIDLLGVVNEKSMNQAEELDETNRTLAGTLEKYEIPMSLKKAIRAYLTKTYEYRF